MAEPTRGPADGGTSDPDDPFQEAMQRCNEFWTAEWDNFERGRASQRFYIGGEYQWLPEAVRERKAANRPVHTINRIPGFVRQVTGDIRKDTPSIKVAPAKEGASEEVADIFNGIIRNIENKSNAKAAYVQAVENACITGLGAFRVNTVYSSDSSFELDIRIERINDPFMVMFDPLAKKPDKSDGRATLIFVDMPRGEYVKRWPDQPVSDFPSGPNGANVLVWWTTNTVRVAEYWYKKPAKKVLLLLEDGRTLTAEEALKETEEGQIISVKEKRTIDTFEVCMRLMNGVDFLTKEVKWPGKHIPIVPVVGEEIWIDGGCYRKGMIDDAKDPQTALNYARTSAIEAMSLQPKMPWLLTVDMIKGHEGLWNVAGTKNLPWLPYNPDPRNAAGKPERAQPALAQAGLDTAGQLAGEDIQSVVGIYNVSLGAKSNETSGRAINARNAQADTGTFHYIDNLATGIRCLGEILVDIIPKIYDTPRIVRVLKEDGDQEMVRVNHPHPQGEVDPFTGALKILNDLSVGEYEVTVITGQSFATRRQEALAGMTEAARAWPKVMEIAGDLMFKSMDVPYAAEIAKRIERTLPPNVTSEEPMPPPPPPPDMVADVQLKTAQAAKARAEAEGKEIENLHTGVDLMAILQGIGPQLAALKAQLDSLSAPPGTPMAAPPNAPPAGPSPQTPPTSPAGGAPPMQGMGELEPIPQGANGG